MRDAAQRNRLLVAAAYIGLGAPCMEAIPLDPPPLQQQQQGFDDEQQSVCLGPKAGPTELSMEQRWAAFCGRVDFSFGEPTIRSQHAEFFSAEIGGKQQMHHKISVKCSLVMVNGFVI
jgi:hypothetical protein